jgi:hypothetical protein
MEETDICRLGESIFLLYYVGTRSYSSRHFPRAGPHKLGRNIRPNVGQQMILLHKGSKYTNKMLYF